MIHDLFHRMRGLYEQIDRMHRDGREPSPELLAEQEEAQAAFHLAGGYDALDRARIQKPVKSPLGDSPGSASTRAG